MFSEYILAYYRRQREHNNKQCQLEFDDTAVTSYRPDMKMEKRCCRPPLLTNLLLHICSGGGPLSSTDISLSRLSGRESLRDRNYVTQQAEKTYSQAASTCIHFCVFKTRTGL